LNDVLTNQGRTAFITGEPGIGKTFLLKEFAKLSLFSNPDLLVLWGQCNAYTGRGDPYFPFINMMRMLVGDLDSLMTGTIISHEHLDRLWYSLADTVGVMVDNGLDLMNRFFHEYNQFSLLEKHKGINFDQLQSLSTIHKNKPKGKIQLDALNDQFTQVLSMISKNHPIILVLDDLQWIDPGSISMLFHLGRNLSGKKIFLIGAFRSEEINLKEENFIHPLVGILQEFQTQFGEILIDLMNCDGEEFSNALLDSEPNDFSPGFYKTLYKHTSGHPLFTIELLREMQIRKEIFRNNLGKWLESRHLNWQLLPARVEAVIARRISFLPKECQLLLECASVQGEIFIVEILARVLGKSENEIITFVDQIICKRHRLISYQGEKRIGNQPFTFYRFRHALFQIYLYNHLLVHEKIRLHGLVFNHLEIVFMNYLNQYPEMLHSLARHSEIGKIFEKAVNYYKLTGKNAVRLAANQEAIDHFNHALILLKTLPQSDKRDKKELELQLSLGPPLTALKGWAPEEMEKAYTRAQELCLHIDDVSQLHPAIWLLALFRLGRSEHAEVDRLVARLVEISKKNNDPALHAMSSLQVSPLYQGKLTEAHKSLEIAGEAPDVNLQRSLTVRYGMAPAAIALGYQGNCLWLLGYPDQAVEMDIKAHELATSIEHQLSLCYVISRSCWLSVLLDNKDQLQRKSDLLSEISHQYGFKNFELVAIFFKNLLELGNSCRRKQKIEAMQYTIQAYLSTGTILNGTGFLVFFAQACLMVGEISRGLNAINESIQLGEKTAELWFQAEAWRTKGELLLAKKKNLRLETWNIKEAEICIRNACQIASHQKAKSFELRAALSFLRLSLIQGDSLNARRELRNIYNWFTEGFNSTDLLEARRLLT
jgi:predicted ATPase